MQKEERRKLPVWVWILLGFVLTIVLIFVLSLVFGPGNNTGNGNLELGATYYLPTLMSGVYNQYPDLDLHLLTYNLTNNGNTQISVTFISEIQDYTSQAKDTIVLHPYESKIFSQHPLLKPSTQIDEITNANLYFKIEADNTTLDEETIPIKMYSKDTMIWGFEENGEFVDTSFLIGAWVTPHINEIDQLIRISAEYHPDRTITGYQCSDCQSEHDWQIYTDLQVKAIYDALQDQYNIVYINTPIAYSSNDESPQRVKLPKESIDLASANCIDGTVLFASALESAGINPKIILIPGHSFICWDISSDTDTVDCLETTMIQNYDFIAAENEGLKEYKDELSSGNFDNGISQSLSIKGLRDYGILPIN